MPNATEPTRNSVGDIVGSWTVTLRYDEASDLLWLTKQRPATPWLRSQSSNSAYPPDMLEAALDDVARTVRSFGARRLF